MKIKHIFIVLIVGFVFWALLLNQCKPDYSTKSTITTTVDSTTIDSLQSIIEKYESIPPAKRDTIRDTLFIPVPTRINNTTNEYTVAYSDSTIGAIITSEVSTMKKGDDYVGILNQQNLSYFIKQEKVREVTNTIRLNTVYTVTNTKTLIENPKPYFSVGAHVGLHDFGPTLSYTNSNRLQLFYQYGVHHNTHSVGFTIPL